MGQQCPVPAFARVPRAKGLVSSVQERFFLPCHSADMAHIKMDPAKVKAVTDWPVPDTRKNLPGFAKFCRRFVQNYSSVAAPLTTLISQKVQFRWSPAADKAFG